MQLKEIKAEHQRIKQHFIDKIKLLNAEKYEAAAALARLEKAIKDAETQYVLSVEHLLESAENDENNQS